MSQYRTVFPKRHTLIVVVHVVDREQALRNVQVAQAEGADGVFLINHRTNHLHLLSCFQYIRERCPDFWIGLNCLDLDRYTALKVLPTDAQGLWTDNAQIDLEQLNPQYEADSFATRFIELGKKALYFGGVAFKYQRTSKDPAKEARLAVPYVDVITTSGDGTGIAADLSKIQSMKEAIGDHPLAIASGITPENVKDYLPHTDCFLVATGVSFSDTELNPRKVRELAQAIS